MQQQLLFHTRNCFLEKSKFLLIEEQRSSETKIHSMYNILSIVRSSDNIK